MYALGMPNAILWGVLAGVLNFIPYLGPIAAFFIFAGAALMTFPTLGQALAVPGVFIAAASHRRSARAAADRGQALRGECARDPARRVVRLRASGAFPACCWPRRCWSR